MKKNSSGKIVWAVIGCLLTIVLAILALVPVFEELLKVEVAVAEPPVVAEVPLPASPEEVPVTVYYIM